MWASPNTKNEMLTGRAAHYIKQPLVQLDDCDISSSFSILPLARLFKQNTLSYIITMSFDADVLVVSLFLAFDPT